MNKPLRNPRWERFAQNLANGLDQTDAYREAGYRESRSNAATLRTKQSVSNRVEQLLAARAEKNKDSTISLASVLADIDQACAMAESRGQANVVLNAAALRAKLGGLMVEKVEIGGVGDFADCETAEEVLAKFVAKDDDLPGMLGILDRMRDVIEERLADRAERIESPP